MMSKAEGNSVSFKLKMTDREYKNFINERELIVSKYIEMASKNVLLRKKLFNIKIFIKLSDIKSYNDGMEKLQQIKSLTKILKNYK